jgi:hypothetical protein
MCANEGRSLYWGHKEFSDMPPDEIAIRQKDRIELAKTNLMIVEGKEFTLKDSLSRIERVCVVKALKQYDNCR